MTGDTPEAASSRAAGGCVLIMGLAAAGGVAYAVPESAYFVAGLLTTTAFRKGRVLVARYRRTSDEPDAAETVDIVEVLRGLASDGQHARLTQLAEAAGLPDTRTVRTLLHEAGIPVRPGVRSGGKNGPGVHHDDVPPLSGGGSGAPSGGCLCSSGANTNANNTPSEGAEEGLRVEPIGQSGSVVRVPGERRAYTV